MNGFGSALEQLVNLLESLELHDLPLVGSKFTFFKGGIGCARSELDNFFYQGY